MSLSSWSFSWRRSNDWSTFTSSFWLLGIGAFDFVTGISGSKLAVSFRSELAGSGITFSNLGLSTGLEGITGGIGVGIGSVYMPNSIVVGRLLSLSCYCQRLPSSTPYSNASFLLFSACSSTSLGSTTGSLGYLSISSI